MTARTLKNTKKRSLEEWLKSGIKKAKPQMSEDRIEETSKDISRLLVRISIIFIVVVFIGARIINNIIDFYFFPEEFYLSLTLEVKDAIVTFTLVLLGVWIIKRLYGPKFWDIIGKTSP